MLTKAEEQQILEIHSQKGIVPSHLRDAYVKHLNEGHKSIFDDPNYLCCDLGYGAGAKRFIWCTFDDCNAAGGSASSNDNCGH
jgi:hypothetical protein